MASRAARKREMIAKLEDEEYINALVEESYAIIFSGSTTNTVAQKKVKKAFESGGCHIGADVKHATWKEEMVLLLLSRRCARSASARHGAGRRN